MPESVPGYFNINGQDLSIKTEDGNGAPDMILCNKAIMCVLFCLCVIGLLIWQMRIDIMY